MCLSLQGGVEMRDWQPVVISGRCKYRFGYSCTYQFEDQFGEQ